MLYFRYGLLLYKNILLKLHGVCCLSLFNTVDVEEDTLPKEAITNIAIITMDQIRTCNVTEVICSDEPAEN